MSRLNGIIKILAINGVLVGIGILIIELAFGGWFDSNRLNRQGPSNS